MSRKIIDRRFFGKFGLSEDPDATIKIHGFSHHYFSTSVMFGTEFMMEEFKPAVAEESKFENRTK